MDLLQVNQKSFTIGQVAHIRQQAYMRKVFATTRASGTGFFRLRHVLQIGIDPSLLRNMADILVRGIRSDAPLFPVTVTP